MDSPSDAQLRNFPAPRPAPPKTCRAEGYFSIVDVVGVLTEQQTAKAASTYWAVMKNRLKKEGADQLLTNCKQLKLKAADHDLTDLSAPVDVIVWKDFKPPRAHTRWLVTNHSFPHPRRPRI